MGVTPTGMKALTSFLVLLAIAAAGRTNAADVVYVQTDTAGVYEGKHGEIVALTPTHVILKSAGKDYLFARDAVHRIVRPGDLRADSHDSRARIMSTYWTTDRSPLVKAVKSLPIVGQPLAVLDTIPPAVAATLASVALCIAVLWAAFKAYDLTVVSRETSRLGRLRLQLEIAKIRHEALDLSRKLKFHDAAVLAALDLPLPEPEMHERHRGEADAAQTKHSRLLVPFMSANERADQRAIYHAEAGVAFRRGSGHARWIRIKRTVWLALGEVLCAFYGLAALMGSVGFFLPSPGSSSPENAAMGAVAATLGILLVRQAVRLALKLRDLRAAYASARTARPGAAGELVTA